MGMRVAFGRGAAVPQQMFYGTFASTPQLSAKHVPLYNDPSTWPKKFNQSQIKRLLKGKMKPGVVPDYKTLEVLHANKKCTEALLFVLHQHIFPSAQYVEDAMARCLAETFAGRQKDGNVFAVLADDQELLNKMQLHVTKSDQQTNETVAMRCGAIPFKRSRSVQRDVRRHVWDREKANLMCRRSKERTALLCNSGSKGKGKTTQLMHTTVEAVAMLTQMVADHRKSGGMLAKQKQGEKDRHRPLGFYVTFNNSVTSTHVDNEILAAKKYPILTAIAMRMVYSVVDTSINRASSSAYQTFARNVAKYCDLDEDYKNFEYIVGALRKQLDWEGPMFVAIDEFLVPYFKTKYQRQLTSGLKTICEDMLDDAKPLLVTPGVEHTVYSRYVAVSVYHAVDTVRLSTISGRPLIAQPMPLLSARDVAQLANHRFSDDLHRSSYIEILGNQRTNVCELRPHQLMILLHIALSTGAPRTMSKWLTRHEIQFRVELLQRQFYRRVTTTTNDTKSHTTATTTKGACFHPDAHTLEKIFWNSNLSLTPQRAEITEAMCIRAAELVAGFAACNIFHSGSDVEYRVFALDSRLAPFCTVTDVESTLSHSDKGNDEPGDTPDSVLRHTRVLVAPAFLRSLAASWPPSGCSSILTYIRALRDTLRHHARLATELVKVGEILVAHGGLLSKEEKKACARLPICDQLIERWKSTTIVGWKQLTFHALCLHLSCALEDDVLKTVASILARVCSSEPIEAVKIAVKKGRLECVDIPNFPSVFNDVFAESDAQLNSDDVFTRMNETLKADPDLCHRAKLKVAVKELSKNVLLEESYAQPPTAKNTSHHRLQTALAKGEHFCFQPSNPNNQGENGVVFLRNRDAVPGAPPTWTILLLQNKFWFGKKHKKTVVEIWRKKLTHLPDTVVDTAGGTHTLRYVRILVTANPVEDSAFATSLSAKSLEERNKRIATIKRANDAFEKLDAAAFDSTRTAADEWVRKVVEENKNKLKTSHKHPIEDSQNKMNAPGKENHRAKESQTKEDESNKHLRADKRAEWLLDHLKIERPTAHDANLDHVICECHMYRDKITQWCPTVGLFVSNIMHIRNLESPSLDDVAPHDNEKEEKMN